MSRCDCTPPVDDGTPDGLSRFGQWTLHLPAVSLTASKPFFYIQAQDVTFSRVRYDLATRQAWYQVDPNEKTGPG